MKHTCWPAILLCLFFAGCASTPTDYTAFRQHHPKSILVLPPLNHSNDVNAGYSVLTTTTRPLAELGYYVFPVVIVDQFLKENGLPTAAEMHQAPLSKLNEVFGADAVLYITVEKYGTKYQIIASNTTIAANAKLVDCASGITLWEGTVALTQGNSSGDPIAALVGAVVDQIVNKLTDQAHVVAAQASFLLLADPKKGLLKGPRHPEFGK